MRITVTRLEQLYTAAMGVTKRTPRKRVNALIRALMKEQRKGSSKSNSHLAAVIYYLSLGTVPQSLWDNS